MNYKSVLFSFYLLLLTPINTLANDAGPADTGKQVIMEVWKEETRGGWQYTEQDIKIQNQILVTLVKGKSLLNIEKSKPLREEITKLPFITYSGK
tara:strand:+ start:1249 stop:1533 length:285 start_codon:yes stop_codon:yes gene_type:complete